MSKIKADDEADEQNGAAPRTGSGIESFFSCQDLHGLLGLLDFN